MVVGKKLSVSQAAARAGVSTQTIRRWVGNPETNQQAKGWLPSFRTAGGHIRIDSDDLERILARTSGNDPRKKSW